MDVRMVVFSLVLVAVTGQPHRRRCSMSRYQSVSSAYIRVIRQLQNEHKDISTSAIKCYRSMIHKPSVCDLMPSDRLILILKRVSLTVDVLQSMSTSGARDPGSQSLMIFLKLRDDLTICKESPGISETPSEELKPWLQHLQDFKDKESPQCLQDTMLLGLIPLLVEDVGCWVHGN
ncbi:interferon lambda-3-like [Anomaloglossus baeobatrachus]|uniref:interferon lambda-3-like n=1 Tax=Anomaloglossus baeobatrachus TaxID=238106 RepID=UPI003F4FC798